MNGLKCAKVFALCISVTGSLLVLYLYSTSSEFTKYGLKWIPSASVSQDISVAVTKALTVPPRQKPLSLRRGGGKKPKRKGVLHLAPNVVLEPTVPKSKTWSADAWKLVEEELHWSRGMRQTDGESSFEPVSRKIVPAYTVKCLDGDNEAAQPWFNPSGDLTFVEDSAVDGTDSSSRAIASLPCMLYVNRSIIYGANKGVFTKIGLPRGLIFGRYKGEYITTMDQSVMARSGYAWALGMSTNGYVYVDAKDEKKSNWLRFINCARFEEEQNLYPIYVEGEIYYLLYKDVAASSELLVWYGRSYGSELGIWFLSNSSATGLAAPRSQIVCPTCRGLPSVEDVHNRRKQE